MLADSTFSVEQSKIMVNIEFGQMLVGILINASFSENSKEKNDEVKKNDQQC